MMLSSINGPYPLALSDRKEQRHGTKSDLIDCLLNAYPQPDVVDPLVTHALIVDGAAAITMMKLRAAKTFLEYAFQVFYRYIENKFQNVSMVDIGIVLTKPPLLHTTRLAPCLQEDADSRMFLHVADAVDEGLQNVTIRNVDTAVVVLAVTFVKQLPIQEL